MINFKKFFLREQVGRTILLFPGSFKPPHKGHFELIKAFKNKVGDNGVVNVVVTEPSEKSRRYTPGGKYVPASVAVEILKRMVDENNLRDVNITSAKNAVKYVYDFIREQTFNGDKVYLGVGAKTGDAQRFAGIDKHTPEGVQVELTELPVIKDETGDISASNLRSLIDNLSIDNLLPFLPDELKNNESFVNFVYNKLSNLPSKT